MTLRVCVILPGGARRDQLWHVGAQQVAKQLNIKWFLTPAPNEVPADQWQDVIGDVDAVITSWGAPRFTDDVLPQSDNLKVIAHAAGSVEPIVSSAIFDRGIKLLSCNRYMANSVAEYALMMTMVGLRQLTVNAQLGGAIKHFDSFTGGGIIGLDQATIGIWGFGDVAKNLIRKLKALATHRIIVHNDYLAPEVAVEMGVEKVGFNDMFALSDVVHLCESLREDTIEKVRTPQLDLMKNNAVIINTGRARLAHETDLLTALKKGPRDACMSMNV